MTHQLSDRQIQVIKIALEELRQRKQQQCLGIDQRPFNEYDIILPQHTLMETLVLLSKFTGQPVAFFANRNPSQTPEPNPQTDEPRMQTGGQGKPPLAAPSQVGTELEPAPPTSEAPSGT